MPDSKILSISIPTWNRAELLEEQLILLTKQIIENNLEDKIEIVISNNGSDDNTEEVVLKFRSKHDFIIYHNNGVNKGPRFNVIKSLELATGKYVTFLGDDDRYKEDSFKKIISLLTTNHEIGAIFDSHLFKKNPFKNEVFISLEQLLENFYYYIGNAGLFIIKTEFIHNNIKKFGYEYFSASWPQTQLITLSLFQNPDKKILLSDLDLFSASAHDQVMMYNSYYLLRGLYFDLADAITDIKNEISPECYASARIYLKKTVSQTTFNILQCGVFVDDKELRIKTISYIKSNLKKYSVNEKIYLSLIIFALSLPVSISRLLSDIFIFAVKGKKGINKKNRFVKLELEKLENKKHKNKAVRTFEF
ncbi:MAG TPA: glycosyltransferase family A protein [Bacteroidia bacterium]|nr:glycosyltransferase family A protein [Bacteroidia bacterium]